MAKPKKNNHLNIQPVPREAIAAVECEEDIVELVRREPEWPIPMTVQRRLREIFTHFTGASPREPKGSV